MQLHTEKLRGLLSSGLDRDEALAHLRDSGVSPMMCVKALLELQVINVSEAKGLVARLKSTSEGSAAPRSQNSTDASPIGSVVQALATLAAPPTNVETVTDQGSWYSVVTAREADVLWRFVWERSVWRLEASPAWAPAESFDADLLARCFLGHALSAGSKSITELMAITAQDLVVELCVVRRSVVEGFRKDAWAETRGRLRRVGHQRDFELFGRPIPPE